MKTVILGAGGFAREVLDIYRIAAWGDELEVAGFVTDDPDVSQVVKGLPILGDLVWLRENRNDYEAISGVGDPKVRKRMIEALQGVRFSSVAHPSVTWGEPMELPIGGVIAANCVLTNTITVGKHVQLNLATTVGHDAVLEDFATTAPGVHISGNVHVEEGAYLGTGAVVLPGLTVGAWSVVGAGAVVTKNVPPGVTVVGSPARPL